MRTSSASTSSPPTQGLQDGAGVRLLQAALDDEPLALLHDLLEGHGAHHGGVAKRLQLAMAAVLSALELDHHKVTVDVDAQRVDPAVRAVELPELLRDQQDAVGYDLALVPQQALQVIALAHLRRGERGLRYRLGPVLRHLEDGHGRNVLGQREESAAASLPGFRHRLAALAHQSPPPFCRGNHLRCRHGCTQFHRVD